MKMGMEFWMAHITALKLEAVPVSEYAKRHGLAVKSLYYWRHKLDCSSEAPQVASKPAKSASTSQFVALRITAIARHQNHCTLALPSGIRLEMSALPSPDWLAALACATQAMQGVR